MPSVIISVKVNVRGAYRDYIFKSLYKLKVSSKSFRHVITKMN